jgi:hypothetical protein
MVGLGNGSRARRKSRGPFRSAGVQRQVEARAAVRPSGSMTQLEATLERLGKLWPWGHPPEDKYRAERERVLGARFLVGREVVAAAPGTAPPGRLV